MRKFLYSIFALCILSNVFSKVEIAERPIDLLQEIIDQHHKVIQAEFDKEVIELSETLSPIFDDTKFKCTNGKDPKSISRHQYLSEFKSGPCNPVVVLPGIGGSKLRAEIDCPTFKAANPKGFAACGWKRCSGL